MSLSISCNMNCVVCGKKALVRKRYCRNHFLEHESLYEKARKKGLDVSKKFSIQGLQEILQRRHVRY